MENLKDEDTIAFWTLSRKPIRLEVGDKVYFVKNGIIDSSMKVIEIRGDGSENCTTTGRTWSGACQLFLDEFSDETSSQLPARGFQGFRYKWW